MRNYSLFSFHREAVNAHDLLLLAGAHALPSHLRRPVGDKVLASEVDLHDGPNSTIKVFYERNSNIRLKLALSYIAHSFYRS